MAIAFVNSAVGENFGGGEDTSIASAGFANTAGNAIVVGIRFWDNDGGKSVSSVTDSSGNTYARIGTPLTQGSGTEMDVWMALDIASSGSNVVTATFSHGVAYRAVMAHQYSGFATSGTLFDAEINVTGTGGTLTTAASLTTAAANELIFAVFSLDSSGVTWTAGSVGGNSFTKRQETSNTSCGCQEYVASATFSSATASVTCSDSSTAKAMHVVTIKESVGGGGGTANPWYYYAQL